MLQSLFNREDKEGKINQHFNKGLQFIEDKLFNQAMIEFKKAMEIDHDTVYPKLLEELDNYSAAGNYEGVLAVGLNLLKDNSEDYELANKLGNCARQIGDYNQANNLYKHALQVNKKYKFSLYNLAASMAKVDRFDDQAISAVQKFDNITDFVLPEYFGNPQLVDEYKEEIKERKKISSTERIQGLQLEKEADSLTVDEIEKINLEIEDLKKPNPAVHSEDILEHFDQLAEEQKEHAFEHLYNKGLYSLSIHNFQVATAIFGKLKQQSASFNYIDLGLVIAKAQEGDYDKAMDMLNKLLGKNRYNRYYNINMGLLYRKKSAPLLAFKYLILTDWLLEKSNGIYNISELEALADKKFEEGRYKDALQFYKVIASEAKTGTVWEKIGDIHLVQNHHEDALVPFQKALQISPKNATAKQKLLQIHKFFTEKGDALQQELKMKPAVENYEKGLRIFRDPETIKKAASIYHQMKNYEKEQSLMEEWHALQEEALKRKKEHERLDYLAKGKQFLKTRNYRSAIEHLESALRMKVDKDVFLTLAQIYKGLKKTADLQDLVGRWNKMVEHEEKMKKYEKIKEREKNNKEEEKNS
ncbi:MAG: tetratricopeptide (TPR) repeat protein [bacterium]|jgi:tetratricopeptide (TPR) repeat protein